MGERPKFAVVREDPDLESELVRLTGASAALVVASGGCTALTLAARFPGLHVAAFDLNPRQLAQVRTKLAAVLAGERARLGVGSRDPGALHERGEFEGLFRVLRGFLLEFVLDEDSLEAYFDPSTAPAERARLVAAWAASRFWPVAFELAFAEPFLHALFGPDATQHAARGSYPGYFQRAFERGLARADGPRNPFLQHLLRGSYREEDAPAFLAPGALARDPGLELVQGSLDAVPDLGRFSVFSLSNVLDWAGDDLARSWGELLAARARPGASVVIRQLNNRREVRRFFEPAFRFDDALGARLLAQDRSLFYERVLVAFRAGGS